MSWRALVPFLVVATLTACFEKGGDDDDDDDDDDGDDTAVLDEADTDTDTDSDTDTDTDTDADTDTDTDTDVDTGPTCDGSQRILFAVDDEVDEIGTSSLSGTLTEGAVTFCAGFTYDVDVDIEGNVTLSSSDAESSNTVFTGRGVDVWEGSYATLTGVTFQGMSGDALYIDNDATLQVEDVVVTGGTATVQVSSGGGELYADQLRIVDNTHADDAILWCGGSCSLTDSEISRNTEDSYSSNVIDMSAGASLSLRDTVIEDNDTSGNVVDVDGGVFSMSGGRFVGNASDYANIDASRSLPTSARTRAEATRG